MKTGGKRKSVKISSNNSEGSELEMSPERKRNKVSNNNEDEDNFQELTDMGVDVLPTSDDEISDYGGHQVLSDKSEDSSVDSFVYKSPRNSVKQSKTAMITRPSQLLPFKHRGSLRNICRQDMFLQLSDEMVLMIFSWLPQQSLSCCALVCHRWRRIVYDETLWTRVDLTAAVLKADYMGYILQRNPLILRMAQATVLGPMFDQTAAVMENMVCQLQYLDLSMALISPQELAQLLGLCPNLKKLSLEHCEADTGVCASIAASADLEVLNLSQCYELGSAGLEEILINCTELVELNLAWTQLNSECIDIVCKLVNENIRMLNLSGGLKWMKDSHVTELVSRCTCLTDLDLSDCTELTDHCLESITKHLCDIRELSFSRCYNIVPNKYMKLNSSKTLQYLNIFGLMHPKQLDTFRAGFKSIQINRHEFSAIARPTVGIRRTSIWGLRVRD